MTVATEPVGILVRRWRERRNRSQLDVASAAELSTRHLSFIETGRSRPSPTMIEKICDELDVPLRERNVLHLAAGFAPAHAERAFTDLGAARSAVEAVLGGLEPNPAMAVNVRWELLAVNRSARGFLAGVPEKLIIPPGNVLTATLHPDGLRDRIVNLADWQRHVINRVRRQLARTRADGLAELLAELESYPDPGPATSTGPAAQRADDLAMPLRLRTDAGELSLLYTLTVFGAPRDVTLDEIAIETFFPADEASATALRAAASGVASGDHHRDGLVDVVGDVDDVQVRG